MLDKMYSHCSDLHESLSRRKIGKDLQEDNLLSADQVWIKEKQKKKNTQPQSPQLQEASSQNPHMLHNILHQKTCWKIDMEGQLV